MWTRTSKINLTLRDGLSFYESTQKIPSIGPRTQTHCQVNIQPEY
jgi:hypothetical protein